MSRIKSAMHDQWEREDLDGPAYKQNLPELHPLAQPGPNKDFQKVSAAPTTPAIKQEHLA